MRNMMRPPHIEFWRDWAERCSQQNSSTTTHTREGSTEHMYCNEITKIQWIRRIRPVTRDRYKNPLSLSRDDRCQLDSARAEGARVDAKNGFQTSYRSYHLNGSVLQHHISMHLHGSAHGSINLRQYEIAWMKTRGASRSVWLWNIDSHTHLLRIVLSNCEVERIWRAKTHWHDEHESVYGIYIGNEHRLWQQK